MNLLGLESRRRAPSQYRASTQSRHADAPKSQWSRSQWLIEGGWRPRETRSISALTMRSTSPGRLSSSQDFSIGRSISLTRSSSVRALLESTVWASELKADSTAVIVVRDRIGDARGAAAASIAGGGS